MNIEYRRTSWGRLVRPAVAGLAALATSGCCTTHDFSLPDFRGRLDFSGSLAFDFDFDADMRFDFDGDFSAWARLDTVTARSLGIDVSDKVAFEQEFDIDIDDDGVDERVSVIGFSDGNADDVDTVLVAWQGDEYTFDDGYCYVLLMTKDTVTLIGGQCTGDSPVLTCTSPADDLDDVSCEVCDENGSCAPCDSTKVAECIDEGADALQDVEPEPDADDDLDPPMPDGGAPVTEPDADAGTTSDAGAREIDGGTTSSGPEAGMSEDPEPDVTESADYQSCLQQVSALQASVALCGLSLSVDADTLCRTSLAAVGRCFSSIDGLGFLENPCDVLQSDDCSEIVE